MDLEKTVRHASLVSLSSEIKNLQAGNNLAIITDWNLEKLYLEELDRDLKSSGFNLFHHVITPGEKSKNPDVYIEILQALAGEGLTRHDGIIALGGGVVGDLAGFIAGTYMRGINIYQVPTSLLAMVDSSIGGKTGIDLDVGKNLVGVFHMPKLVLQDVSLLKTLPEEEFKNGMAEVLKYGILIGGDFYKFLKEEADKYGTYSLGNYNDEEYISFLNKIVRTCSEYKLKVVEEDPRDEGRRALLNLGHTIGHSIEKISDYTIKHGIAVAKGLSAISEFAKARGLCKGEVRDDINSLFEQWGFDLSIPFNGRELIDGIKKDKKRRADDIELIIPTEIGDCEINRIHMEELEKWLVDEYGV